MAINNKLRGLRQRLSRAATLGGLSARTSAGWLTGILLEGLGRSAPAARLQRAAAARVADRLGEMKGLAMKMGQIISFAFPDVPQELRDALAALQTYSGPRPFEEISVVIERALGRPLKEAFRQIEPSPLAAASIGQVHRAVMPDEAVVVVKVQYPDVAAAIRADLANVSLVLRSIRLLLPGVDPDSLASELRERVLDELDYTAESRNQSAFAARYSGHPFIMVPRVFTSHSAGAVLTSEYVDGRRFQEALGDAEPARSAYGEILFRFLFGSVFSFGVFNADPHPGNYLFDPAASRVTFLDFGCVKRLPPELLKEWRLFIRALLDGDRRASANHAVNLGFVEGGDVRLGKVLEVLARIYVPFRQDESCRLAPALSTDSMKTVLGKEFVELRRCLRFPKDLVFATRVMVGMYMVLARLGATANWYRISREYLCGDHPSTPLGAGERAWSTARRMEALVGPQFDR